MKNSKISYSRKTIVSSLFLLLAIFMPLSAQDSFFDDIETEDTESSTAGVQFGGFASFGVRYLPHEDVKHLDVMPRFGLTVRHESSKTEAEAVLCIDKPIVETYHWDALQELTLRAYLGDFVLSAGKMKLVWGKGDMLHVLDNFNANDTTNFLIPDYIDRRLAEPMVHIAYNAPIPLRLEAVWTPIMTPDRLAKKGPWVPSQGIKLKNTLTKAFTAALKTGKIPSSMVDDAKKNFKQLSPKLEKRPDVLDLQYGQYGLRLTGTAGPVDMGGQYYYGHYKTPSFDTLDLQKIITTTATAVPSVSVDYDPVHIFGLDLGAAIAMFNLRSEFAYYMTYDYEGTDPAVHNNSFKWLLGFDVGIPLNNININVQNIGSYVIGFDKVEDNVDAKIIDMDWSTSEKSTDNKLVVKISDTWLHEALTDSVTVVWGIEHNDAIIMPAIKYKIKDEFYIEGKAAYIYAEDDKSEFPTWKDNHYFQVSFQYNF